MKNGFGKRLTSMMVALCMLLTVFPASVLAVGGEVLEITTGELVAKAYADDLSDAEKALLKSKLLPGTTFKYVMPNDEDSQNLITVDTENKKVSVEIYTDNQGNAWLPIGAAVYVGDEKKEDITLVNGEGTYAFAENAFSVVVDYALHTTVDVDTQKALLNTAGLLKDGVAKLDALADSGIRYDLESLEAMIPTLLDYASNGLPGYSNIKFGNEESTAALNALNGQMVANGGKTNLSVAISAYRNAVSKTQYLLNDAAAMKAEVENTSDHVAVISVQLSAFASNLQGAVSWGVIDQNTANVVQGLANTISGLDTALAAVKAEEWSAAETGAVLVKTGIIGDEYIALDGLVAALSTVVNANDLTISEELLVAETNVRYNLSMKNVTVVVELKVVENIVGSETLESGGDSKSVTITLADGANLEEEVLPAIEETGIEAAAKESWSNYEAMHFERIVTVAPEVSNLTENITYTITYVPCRYTVTYGEGFDGREADEFYYGYQGRLDAYDGAENLVYDYTVDGEYYPENSTYEVSGDMIISRVTGDPYSITDLYKVVAEGYGSPKELAILTSGALLGNEEISVRMPVESGLVSMNGTTLTANVFPASYNGLYWEPYTYTVDDGQIQYFGAVSEGKCIVTIEKVDYQSIEVDYRLTMTNYTANRAQEVLDLAKTLAEEAAGQQASLNSLCSEKVTTNMNKLNRVMLNSLKGVIEDPATVLHETELKNSGLKNLYLDVVVGIRDNCIGESGSLNLAGLINACDRSLEYYYENSAVMISEVSVFSDYLDQMLATDENFTEDEKKAAMTVLIKIAVDAGLIDGDPAEYVADLDTLRDNMATVKNNLKTPNAAIDLESSNLRTLIRALQSEGTVGTTGADYPYLPYSPKPLAGSGLVVLSVTVKYGEKSKSVTVTTAQGELSQPAVDTLKAKIAEVRADWGISNDFLFGCDAYNGGAALDDLVGTEYTSSKSLGVFTWEDIERTACEIAGKHLGERTVLGYSASCTKNGLTDGIFCDQCQQWVKEQESITSSGHTKETVLGTPATCLEGGWTDSVVCDVCDETLQAAEPIAALGHDFPDTYQHDDKDHWRVCQRQGCGVEERKGHTYGVITDCAAAAPCTTVGCDYEKSADPNAHVWGWKQDPNNENNHIRYCLATNCSEEMPSEAHTWIPGIVTEPATCDEPGAQLYSCTCEAEKTVELPALGHSYGDWKPYDDDNHRRTCTRPGCTAYEEQEHNWGDPVDISDNAYKETCKVESCGHSRITTVNVSDKLEDAKEVTVYISPDEYSEIVVPQPEGDESNPFTGGYRYDYRFYINGVESSKWKVNNSDSGTTKILTLTAEEHAAFMDGRLKVTKKLVNINNEKLDNLLLAIGKDAVAETDPNRKPTQDGYYTGITVTTDMAGMMNVVMQLVMNSGYGNIELGGEPLMDEEGAVSVLSLLRVLMGKDDELSNEEIIALANGSNPELLNTTLLLGVLSPRRSMADINYHLIDFVVNVTQLPAEMATVSKALENAKKWFTFELEKVYDETAGEPVLVENELLLDIHADLPEKVYEIYVAALRLSGKLESNDVNAVSQQVAYEFLLDYIKVLLGAEVSTTTLANTAAKLNYTIDLSAYENLFGALKGRLDYGDKLYYQGSGIGAELELDHEDMTAAINKLVTMGVVDAGVLSFVTFKECKETAKPVLVTMQADVTDFGDGGDGLIETEYEAIVIDVGAKDLEGITQKMDVVDLTTDLEESVSKLTSYAAIMLQKDVVLDAPLHFNHATILDLNGYTLTGDISSAATLIIIDSKLDAGGCGTVNGSISGEKVTILAGKYSSDVSGFLKDGYVLEDYDAANKIVKNKYYSIAADDSEVTFLLNADLLNGVDRPSAKHLAVDITADLAMNYFTTASLKLNGSSIYAVNFEDLIELYTDKENRADRLLAIIDVEGIEDLVNTLIEDSMNFAVIKNNIEAEIGGEDKNIFEYSMVTAPWKVVVDKSAIADQLTVGVVPGEEKTRTIGVKLSGSTENKQALADLADELSAIVKADTTTISVDLNQPVLEGAVLTEVASGAAVVDIDMSGNPNYAALISVALAYAGAANKAELVAALDEYFENGYTADLKDAFDEVTTAELVGALKAFRTADLSTMAAAIGVTNVSAEAYALEGVYHKLLVSVGAALINQKVNGGSQTMKNLSDNAAKANAEDDYGVYLADKESVIRSFDYTASGITVKAGLTLSTASFKVTLFGECDHNWNDATCTTPKTCSICGETEGEPLGHTYDDAEYNWEGTTLTVTLTCNKCEDGTAGKILTGSAEGTEVSSTDGDCGTRSSVTYEATVTLNGTPYTDQHTIEGEYGTHSYGDWTQNGSDGHKRVCVHNAEHIETEAHSYGDDNICDVCDYRKSSGGTVTSYAITVLNGDVTVKRTNSLAVALKEAKEGYTIKITRTLSMTEHVYVNYGIKIVGADKLRDTGYVLYLNDLKASIAADAELNVGSAVAAYKAAKAEDSFTYALSEIDAPKGEYPVAGSKVEKINDDFYLFMDMTPDGMTLNALREKTAFEDLSAGTLKFDIEGNDGTGLIKTSDRMTVSAYNADNNCVATITYVVIVMGDTNCNGKVNTSDATVMKNINFGESYPPEVLMAADVNFSGTTAEPKINSSDAAYIMSKWFAWSKSTYESNLK